MIPLSALSDPSDVVACIALATLATVFGLLPGHLVMPCWRRKRQEIGLLFALAALRRGASAMHLNLVEVGLQIATAVATTAAAYTAVRSLVREVRRERTS